MVVLVDQAFKVAKVTHHCQSREHAKEEYLMLLDVFLSQLIFRLLSLSLNETFRLLDISGSS